MRMTIVLRTSGELKVDRDQVIRIVKNSALFWIRIMRMKGEKKKKAFIKEAFITVDPSKVNGLVTKLKDFGYNPQTGDKWQQPMGGPSSLSWRWAVTIYWDMSSQQIKKEMKEVSSDGNRYKYSWPELITSHDIQVWH